MSIYTWVVSWNPVRLENLLYFKELFRGIKDKWGARAYPAVWMLRRIIFAGTMLLLPDININWRFGVMGVTQLVYIMFLYSELPFLSIIESVAELSNEVFILGALAPLVYYNEEKRWTDGITIGYLAILLTSNVIFTCLSLCK